MRLGSIVAIGLVVAGLTIATAVTAEADVYCEDRAVFAAGGMGDPQALAFPGTRRVHYSASIWPIGPVTYDESVREGSAAMVSAVNAYAAVCPGQIVVTGYSQGARVAGDAIDTLDNGPYAERIEGVLYSDPKRPGGIETTFQGVSIAGVTMTGPRQGTTTIPVRSECNEQPGNRDGICSLPIGGIIDGALGYLGTAHSYNLTTY